MKKELMKRAKQNNIIPFPKYKVDDRPAKGWWAPGKYLNICRICKEGFIGDKRAGYCADCEYGKKKE